jgi:hypothetical protein
MALRIARSAICFFATALQKGCGFFVKDLRCLLADFIFSHQDEKMEIS